MKTCSKCGLVKEESGFCRDRTQKDGLGCWCKKCCKEHRQSKRGKEADRRYSHKRWLLNPLKEKARNVVKYAIKTGRLVRETCEASKCNVIGQAHHDDYSKPLDVRWLCSKHHTDLHRKECNGKNNK